MATSGGRPPNRRVRNRVREAKQPAWLVPALKKTVAGLCVVGGLLALPQAADWLFFPQISITPQDPLSPTNPFTAPFEVQNGWFLSVKDVTVSCHVNGVWADKTQFGIRDLTYETPQYVAELEGHGGQQSVYCTWVNPDDDQPITYADVVVAISYRPAFGFRKHTRNVRFITARQSDGKFRWEHFSLSARPQRNPS